MPGNRPAGRPPLGPDQRKQSVPLSLSPQVIDKLNTLANKHGVSRSHLADTLLAHILGIKGESNADQ